MGEFFRGWRRKVGVVMLLMACMLTGAWLRSRSTIDLIKLNNTRSQSLFSSGGEQILFLHGINCYLGRQVAQQGEVHFVRITPFPRDFFASGSRIEWFSTEGSKIEFVSSPDFEHVKNYMIPYWLIVIPLTLISAYLMLVKPRSKKPASLPTDTL